MNSSSIQQLISAYLKMPLVAEALALLRKELPTALCYHVPSHTEDVLSEAVHFATYDKLGEKELKLLVLAAAFHDTGFLDKHTENEEAGAARAMAAMQASGEYNRDECALVHQMILDTKVVFDGSGPRQIPHAPLSKYLLDADVSNLGREDFFEKAELVRQEVGVADKQKFLESLVIFMQAHRWYTDAAQALRQKRKEKNFAELVRRVKTGKH